LVALVAACSPNPNAAGVTDTGTVIGAVVDAKTKQPLQTATIQIGAQSRYLSPSDTGQFTFQRVPIGTQPVLIKSPGYNGYPTQVVVRKDQTSDLHVIGLTPSTGF
jgi:CarboxypepD_reg-like domain